MGNVDIQPEGDRIRKAVKWICDTLAMYPEKTRDAVIKDAGIRFDLTPKECSFLDRKLMDQAKDGSGC
ncbi:MAG: hypothetical protein KKE17_04610 [Proteobacteria bacterium]|nr:hypothetical protein [Pseudomonadota bacterium]MBU1709269.1 hypothetical protein [Pseudomonadota bacterium]